MKNLLRKVYGLGAKLYCATGGPDFWIFLANIFIR